MQDQAFQQITRREFLGRAGSAAVVEATAKVARAQQRPDYTLTIGAGTLEGSPKHVIKTVGYSGTIPGPLLRLREGRPVRIDHLIVEGIPGRRFDWTKHPDIE